MSAKRPIRDLERELKREPANLALRLTLAAAYREAARASDAVELYRSVARTYLEQGRVGQAAAVCKSALEIAPTDSELYGMLHHLERTGAATMPPPMGAPVGSAPAMPVSLTTTLMGNAPPPPPTPAPQMIDGPPSRPARVLPADVALREVGSVAPATVKHVPPPPPPAAVPAPAPPPPRSLGRGPTPTGRNSTLDGDTPLPDPLALHDSTGRDSLVEMVELLTSPSPSPAAPPPPLPPPAQARAAPPPPSPAPMRPKLGAIPGARPVTAPDDDSETIVPLTQVRNAGNRAPAPPTDPPTLVARSAPSTEPPPLGPRGAPTTPPPMGRGGPHTSPPMGTRTVPATSPPPMGPRGSATPPTGTPRAAPPSPPPGPPRPGGATRPPPPTRPPASGGGGLPRLTATSPPPPRVSAPPPAPIDDAPTELGALPSSADYSAEMVTRKRPKLSARDLLLLDLDPMSADAADTGVDEALTNPGNRGPAVASPSEPEPQPEPPLSRAPSESTATARHPATLVEDDDDGDTGDTGDTGRNQALVFDDEPTHPPPASAGADGTLRASEAAHDQLHRPDPADTAHDPDEHEHTGDHTSTRPSTEESSTELSSGNLMQSFDAALSALGPDGSVLEGPLGVFSMLPPEAAQELSRRAVVKQFDAGDVIIQEGEMGDACYVIAHGEVVVQRRSDDEIGGMVELARLSDGSLFGEFALLADRRRHATVVATTEVEVFEIPRLLLRELAAVFPEVGPALERFYRERLLANLLRTTPLFSLVAEEQRPALLARFHPLHADSGQAIVRQGERAGGLYLIVLGAVEVVRRVGERRAVVLATLGEGAYFGEMSLLSGEMASASVVAAGPCELAVLPPRDFYDLVAHNPELWITMRTVAEARRLTNAQILAGHTGIV